MVYTSRSERVFCKTCIHDLDTTINVTQIFYTEDNKENFDFTKRKKSQPGYQAVLMFENVQKRNLCGTIFRPNTLRKRGTTYTPCRLSQDV